MPRLDASEFAAGPEPPAVQGVARSPLIGGAGRPNDLFKPITIVYQSDKLPFMPIG
jgi:hypothetical protein